MDRRTLLAAYLRQQKELGVPDVIVGQAEKARSSLKPSSAPRQVLQNPAAKTSPPDRRYPAVKNGAIARQRSKNPYDRLSRLAPAASTVSCGVSSSPAYSGQTGSLSFEQKRALFKELYAARCGNCALAQTRKTFVFGSGNVDAALMIIGEAPGAEEDAQGLPFVGAAGQLLTELLAGVAIDRKKDVFITNILKCRPPDNRTPDANEIISCLPLVQKQIEVIAPRLLLLLGRIAAHALLGPADPSSAGLRRVDSIAKLRSRVHEYKGIPAVVTYHPAAILRNPEYRGPTEDDLRKVARLLKEGGYHGTS